MDQRLIRPPSLHDWLPQDHLARFVADLVPSLNRSASWAGYAGYNEKDRRAGEGGEIRAHGAKPKEAVRVSRLAETLQLAHMPIKKLTRQPEQPIGQTC